LVAACVVYLDCLPEYGSVTFHPLTPSMQCPAVSTTRGAMMAPEQAEAWLPLTYMSMSAANG
jgi:hypothetical protein